MNWRSRSSLRQCASAVLMVAPDEIGFNTETGVDNHFQSATDEPAAALRARAIQQFHALVAALQGEGVDVVVMPPAARKRVPTPDATFVNNWISCDHLGTVWTWPLRARNRRAERRPRAAEQALEAAGYRVVRHVNLGPLCSRRVIVEGTGSLVFDHLHRRVFAALSARCHKAALSRAARELGYRPLSFATDDGAGRSIYHTNVMLSIGEALAVVCLDAVCDEGARQLLAAALRRHHEVLSLRREQLATFSGNILQLAGGGGRRLWAMSQAAHDGFSADQRAVLARHGRLVAVDISAIEGVGGGSVRCMLAEVFLPRRRAVPLRAHDALPAR